jgi:hypothetical protein
MLLRNSRLARLRLVLSLALACALTGCALTFDARSLGVPATMAGAAAQPVAGDTFAVTTRAIHALWGLYPVRTVNLQNVLAGQLAGGASVANLRIRVRRTWSDLLVTAVTLGVVNPTAVTLEGVIVPPPR